MTRVTDRIALADRDIHERSFAPWVLAAKCREKRRPELRLISRAVRCDDLKGSLSRWPAEGTNDGVLVIVSRGIGHKRRIASRRARLTALLQTLPIRRRNGRRRSRAVRFAPTGRRTSDATVPRSPSRSGDERQQPRIVGGQRVS
jgi:hypothetical protein